MKLRIFLAALIVGFPGLVVAFWFLNWAQFVLVFTISSALIAFSAWYWERQLFYSIGRLKKRIDQFPALVPDYYADRIMAMYHIESHLA